MRSTMALLQALFVPGVLLQQLAQDVKADLLADAALLGVKGDEVAHLHHACWRRP